MSDGRFYGNQHTGSPFDDYGYDDLLAAIQALATDLGRPPTTRDAERDDRFPSIKTIYRTVETDWPTALRDAGLEPTKHQRRSANTDRTHDILDDLRTVNDETHGEHLTTRQYDQHGAYATSSVKERFGSWTTACTEAGIPHGYRHGYTCTGPHGERLDSYHEHAIATALHDHGLDYEPHPRIPETRWRADFLLTDADLWIEVDGYVNGGRPNQEGFQEKLDHYDRERMNYAVIQTPDDLDHALRNHGIIPDS